MRPPAASPGLAALAAAVAAGGVTVLSGAGLSTESGIPDYRGPTGLARRARPMSYQSFLAGPAARQRYWARSHLGWREITRAAPNDGHHAVADLQGLGLLRGLITQNVDGLHQAGGARDVVELHGSLARVVCLSCGARGSRAALDRRLAAANPRWQERAGWVNPDGDAELAPEQISGFRVVDCAACGGLLKPDVVFFGENVPPQRVAAAFELVEDSRLLLVLGSSLSVMSGYRFVRRAAQRGIPVAIVNQGATRGDPLAWLKLDLPLGAALGRLRALVAAGRGFPEAVRAARLVENDPGRARMSG